MNTTQQRRLARIEAAFEPPVPADVEHVVGSWCDYHRVNKELTDAGAPHVFSTALMEALEDEVVKALPPLSYSARIAAGFIVVTPEFQEE
jgi:hypothetical protein